MGRPFLHKYVSIVIRYPLNAGGQGAACLLKLKTDEAICIRRKENVVRYVYMYVCALHGGVPYVKAE